MVISNEDKITRLKVAMLELERLREEIDALDIDNKLSHAINVMRFTKNEIKKDGNYE